MTLKKNYFIHDAKKKLPYDYKKKNYFMTIKKIALYTTLPLMKRKKTKQTDVRLTEL